MFNVLGKIGGDAELSPRGLEFARSLPNIIRAQIPEDQQLTVWTSTLRRTMQTAENLPYPKLQWKALDEIDAGLCDGMTYEEIEVSARFMPFLIPDLGSNNIPMILPRETRTSFVRSQKIRMAHSLDYRYRGGESYKDLVLRLEPIIMELERQQNIVIIGHQAVLRAICMCSEVLSSCFTSTDAYFLNLPHDQLPYVHVPLHTVIKLTPKAYGCEEETFSLPIEAVDTHRPRSKPGQRSSYGEAGPLHILVPLNRGNDGDQSSQSTVLEAAVAASFNVDKETKEDDVLIPDETKPQEKSMKVHHQLRRSPFTDPHGVLPVSHEAAEEREEGGI